MTAQPFATPREYLAAIDLWERLNLQHTNGWLSDHDKAETQRLLERITSTQEKGFLKDASVRQ